MKYLIDEQRWRVGGSWRTTLVFAGRGEPDERGRRADDFLAGWIPNNPELAERIVRLLNEDDARTGRGGPR